jgi:branched-chain amino acid transport system permease protein
LVIFTAWLGSAYRDEAEWIDVGTRALYLATAAVGLNVLAGYTGLLSLGHAGFFVAGGWFGAVLAPGLGLDPWLGFPVAFVLGAALGAVLALLCCHLRGLYLTVVTLAFGTLVPTVFAVLDHPSGVRLEELLDTADLPLADGDFRVGLLWVAAAVLLVSLALTRNLVRSRWGRAYMAIRESETAATACGIPTYWYKVSAFAVSAGIVALAGTVGVQPFLNVNPGEATTIRSFQLVVMVVLGGIGTILGPVVGALVLEFGLAVDWVQDTFADNLGLFFGGTALVLVALAPEGAAGLVRRAQAWVGRRRLSSAPAVAPARREAPVSSSSDKPTSPPDDTGASLPSAPPAAVATGQGDGLLELEGVVKRFGGLAALAGVDLAVTQGTVHALIGPNGSGKSTLVNVVSGAYRTSDGHVRLAGTDVTHLPAHARARAGVARTFQNLQVWRRMTVLDNVLVGAHRRSGVGLPRALLGPWASRRDERALVAGAWGLLDLVGLTDRAHDPAGALSFAHLRRVELARALASQPSLLLLDEPAAGLHPDEAAELVGLLRSVRATGVTVLLVEHHMDVVMGLSDVVTVLDYGEKIAEGPPEVVRHDPRVVEAYLGAEDAA